MQFLKSFAILATAIASTDAAAIEGRGTVRCNFLLTPRNRVPFGADLESELQLQLGAKLGMAFPGHTIGGSPVEISSVDTHDTYVVAPYVVAQTWVLETVPTEDLIAEITSWTGQTLDISDYDIAWYVDSATC